MSEAQQASHSTWKTWWLQLSEWDKGGRADLRRCGTLAEVLFTPSYHRLLKMLGSRLGTEDQMRVALCAALLAHVEKDVPARSFGETMGGPRNERTVVSETRFRHLLQADIGDELLRDLVRLLRLVDREAPLDSLASDLMRWGDDVRRRWAFDYYGQSLSSSR